MASAVLGCIRAPTCENHIEENYLFSAPPVQTGKQPNITEIGAPASVNICAIHIFEFGF